MLLSKETRAYYIRLNTILKKIDHELGKEWLSQTYLEKTSQAKCVFLYYEGGGGVLTHSRKSSVAELTSAPSQRISRNSKF